MPPGLRADVIPPVRVPPGGDHTHLRVGSGSDAALEGHGAQKPYYMSCVHLVITSGEAG